MNIVLELQSKGFDKVKVESKASIRNRRYLIVDSTGAPRAGFNLRGTPT